MIIEFWISIAAVVIVLVFARVGMHFGVFYEAASTVLLFLAMLVALRFWYSLTWLLEPWFNGELCAAEFVSFWVLFLLGAAPLAVLMNRVTVESMPRYPRLLDGAIGFVCGGLSAAIVVCAILTSFAVVAPKVWPEYQPDRLIWPLDRFPISLYQSIEKNWVGVPPTDAAHTRFPTFQKADADDLHKFWQ